MPALLEQKMRPCAIHSALWNGGFKGGDLGGFRVGSLVGQGPTEKPNLTYVLEDHQEAAVNRALRDRPTDHYMAVDTR